MTKREVYKEEAYFQDFIAFSEEVILRYEVKIREPNIEKYRLTSLHHGLLLERLHLLIARYSIGETIDHLKVDFPKVVESFVEYYGRGFSIIDFNNIDSYVISLWMISLAILLDMDDEIITHLVSVINQDGRDAVFENLVHLRIKRIGVENITTLVHSKPYRHLYQAIIRKESQQDYINKFLKEYYRSMRSTYWYGSHKEDDAGFFGYWCFELAAFVRFLDIDDRTFADNIFYPRDLTGRQLLRTWEDSEVGAADRALFKKMNEASGSVS